MRSSYLIMASLVASLASTPALARAPDVNPRAVQAPIAPPAQPLPGAAPLSAAASEKAGCGAVLLILGKVADTSPEMFAKQSNGKAMQTLFSALGLKGKVMMDEAFAEGAGQGLTATQTYEAGVVGLLGSIKADIAGASPRDAGRNAGVALMKRCTGLGE